MATTTVAPLLNWNDSFSVNVGEVDNQHKKLVSLINRLHEAMGQGKSKEVLAAILAELVNYTKIHFAYEERLMQTHGYPDLAAHKLQHDRLTSQVMEFAQEFSAGRTMLSIDLMHFLKNWLQTHIKGTDKKYSPFLASKGVR